MPKRRDKGDGAVYKRKSDGLWCATIELPPGIDGKRRRKVICRKDRGSVIVLLREKQDELKKVGNLSTNTFTVESWMNKWMTDIAPLEVRPKTLAGYRTVVNGYIIPTLGKKRLDRITAEDVRQLHAIVQRTPKDPALRKEKNLPEGTVLLSSTYALLVHNTLSVALKTAVREGHMSANPCDLVNRPRKRVTEQKALTAEQAIKLLAYLTTHPECALWSSFILSGARRGEILGLEVDRVTNKLDLSWQLQRITDISRAPADWEYRTLGGTLYLTRPKSQAGWRELPLVEPLKSILALHMQNVTSGLVFTREGKPWDPDRATKEWAKLLSDAGLPSDIVLHGARHTVVDLLYAAGTAEVDIMAIVGHSSRSVTRGYKSRGDSKQLTAVMEGLSRQLNK